MMRNMLSELCSAGKRDYGKVRGGVEEYVGKEVISRGAAPASWRSYPDVDWRWGTGQAVSAGSEVLQQPAGNPSSGIGVSQWSQSSWLRGAL